MFGKLPDDNIWRSEWQTDLTVFLFLYIVIQFSIQPSICQMMTNTDIIDCHSYTQQQVQILQQPVHLQPLVNVCWSFQVDDITYKQLKAVEVRCVCLIVCCVVTRKYYCHYLDTVLLLSSFSAPSLFKERSNICHNFI